LWPLSILLRCSTFAYCVPVTCQWPCWVLHRNDRMKVVFYNLGDNAHSQDLLGRQQVDSNGCGHTAQGLAWSRCSGRVSCCCWSGRLAGKTPGGCMRGLPPAWLVGYAIGYCCLPFLLVPFLLCLLLKSPLLASYPSCPWLILGFRRAVGCIC
jgi:hypothetical protein